jgi:signal peptidase I
MPKYNENNSDLIENAEDLIAKKNNARRDIVAWLLEYVEILVFSLAFVVVLFTFFVRLCAVKGDSMNQTLLDKERLIVSNILYEPEYGDIIVFHQTGALNEPVVKRVIAVGGETIDIDFDTWTITVTDDNNNIIRIIENEEYIYLDPQQIPLRSNQTYPLRIPEGHLFVMGDNRNISLDSRNLDIGCVDQRRVLGKVIFRISPINKIGTVD